MTSFAGYSPQQAEKSRCDCRPEWPIVAYPSGAAATQVKSAPHARQAAGRILLRDLQEHATQPEFVFRHSWKPGDLVLWDSRT